MADDTTHVSKKLDDMRRHVPDHDTFVHASIAMIELLDQAGYSNSATRSWQSLADGESTMTVDYLGRKRDLAELADERFTPVFLRNATAYGFSPRLRGGRESASCFLAFFAIVCATRK